MIGNIQNISYRTSLLLLLAFYQVSHVGFQSIKQLPITYINLAGSMLYAQWLYSTVECGSTQFCSSYHKLLNQLRMLHTQ